MTATDPRPELAAMLAERLAPAARALAEAYAEDICAAPPPEDDRACAERHRAGRAQLIASAPAPRRARLGRRTHARTRTRRLEPACGPDEARDEPRPYVSDYDGGEDEFHYGGEVYVGSQETPEFRAWLADVERRAGPLPWDSDRLLSSMIGERLFVGDLDSPEYHEWHERQDRRDREELERWLDGDDPDDDADGAPRAEPTAPPGPPERHAPTPPHDKT